MRVVAVQPAFHDAHLVCAGDVLDIPEGTQGRWFALAGTPRADAALAKVEKPPAWETRCVEMREPEVNPLDYDPYGWL